MRLEVSYQGGTRYDVESGTHRVITDQSVADGGQEAGPTPVEMFVGSLASCVAYFVGQFCIRHDIPRDGLKVEAEWTIAEQPHRVGRVDLSIQLPRPLAPELKDRLLKVAQGCTVHQSLAVAPTVGITVDLPHPLPEGNLT